MDRNLFKQYYRKMAIFGILKALIFSSIFAFASLFISSLLFWLLDIKMMWLCFVIFIAVLIISTIVSYFVKYRPNDKLIAKKLDETGLEERMITMLELEGNDSFIARKQREDTLNTVKNVNSSLLKFAISIPIVVSAIIVSVFAIPMTVTASLSSAGILSSGQKIISDITNDTKTYKVSYEVVGNGVIEGEATQVVNEGATAKAITLVPKGNSVLVTWLCNGKKVTTSDKNQLVRIDKNITKDVVYTAILEEVLIPELEDEGMMDIYNTKNSDKNDPNNPFNLPSPQNQNPSQNDDGDSGSGAGGGRNDPSSQIRDNELYYGGSTYQNYKADEMDKLKNNGVSDGDRDISSGYFDSIKD